MKTQSKKKAVKENPAQSTLFNEEPKHELPVERGLLRNLKHGKVFRFIYPSGKLGENLLMKVKPVNFICNSTIVNDMIMRRNCLVVNLNSGNLFISKGEHEVVASDVVVES